MPEAHYVVHVRIERVTYEGKDGNPFLPSKSSGEKYERIVEDVTNTTVKSKRLKNAINKVVGILDLESTLEED